MKRGDNKPTVKRGDRFTLNDGNTAIIVKYENSDNVYIRIKETGTRITVRTENLKLGKVKDPNKINVCGVGFMGEGEHKPTLFSDGLGKAINPVYALWINMLHRCYGKNQSECYKNVEVCDEWKCFQTFANDVQKLPGFDEWIRGGALDFDKDLRSNNVIKKEYNPNNCQFIPLLTNRLAAMKGKQTNSKEGKNV